MTKKIRQPSQDPRSTIERGKEHVEKAEDRAARNPSPAREAGDGPPAPGKRERALATTSARRAMTY